MSIQEFLKDKVPFLRGLTDDQLTYLSGQIQELKFEKGSTILFKGASVDGLHIVAAGKASVHLKPDKNKGWVQVAELKVGDIFGETSIIEYKMAGATIKSAANDTVIYVISQEPFLKLLKTDPDLKTRIVELIKDRQSGRHKDDKKKEPAKAAPAAGSSAAPAETPPPAEGDAAPPQDPSG